jgi:hypothetical protein
MVINMRMRNNENEHEFGTDMYWMAWDIDDLIEDLSQYIQGNL